MAKCDVADCEEIIEYLPFRCKYCGGTFCKKHRLPENHNCSFSMPAAEPVNQTPLRNSRERLYVNNAESDFSGSSQNQNETEDERLEREMREYIKRQEREARSRANVPRATRAATRYPGGFGFGTTPFQVTKWLMGLNLIFFIACFIFPEYILLSILNLIFVFPFVTSMFVPGVGFWGIISAIFTMLILYGIGRQIETRFGSKFLITLYAVGGLLAGLVVVVLEFLYLAIGLDYLAYQFVTTQNASLLALITFFIYIIGLDREMQFFLFFIPVRLKAKHILIILLVINLIFGFLGNVESFGSLMGLLVGKLFYNSYSRHSVSDYY